MNDYGEDLEAVVDRDREFNRAIWVNTQLYIPTEIHISGALF